MKRTTTTRKTMTTAKATDTRSDVGPVLRQYSGCILHLRGRTVRSVDPYSSTGQRRSIPFHIDAEICKISNRFPAPCIQRASAKFDSSAVENRFRQPASPLLTRSDSSQPKFKNSNGNM